MRWKADLLVQFLLALVSGGVAGLMAGWVLMHWQIRNQLEVEVEVEERAKVLKIVQALNSERYKTEASIAFQELVNGGIRKKLFVGSGERLGKG